MNIVEKTAYARQHLRSIIDHGDEPLAERIAAIDALIADAKSALAEWRDGKQAAHDAARKAREERIAKLREARGG